MRKIQSPFGREPRVHNQQAGPADSGYASSNAVALVIQNPAPSLLRFAIRRVYFSMRSVTVLGTKVPFYTKWQLRAHGAASCRCATRPVLRTRPGHPPEFLISLRLQPG